MDRAGNEGQAPQTPGASTALRPACELEDLYKRGLVGLSALALGDLAVWAGEVSAAACRQPQTP